MKTSISLKQWTRLVCIWINLGIFLLSQRYAELKSQPKTFSACSIVITIERIGRDTVSGKEFGESRQRQLPSQCCRWRPCLCALRRCATTEFRLVMGWDGCYVVILLSRFCLPSCLLMFFVYLPKKKKKRNARLPSFACRCGSYFLRCRQIWRTNDNFMSSCVVLRQCSLLPVHQCSVRINR